MGSAVSIAPPGVDEDIRELLEHVEQQKARIRQADAALLEAESPKMFKNHSKIIEELSARSKTQLRMLATELPASLAQLEMIASSGNQYAAFLAKLHKTKLEIDLDALLAAPDYDEELVVGILSTSTTAEIKALDEAFRAAKGFSLRDLLESKVKAGTSLGKLVDRIFQFRRDEGKETNAELAEKQAEMLHAASSARLVGVDEDVVVNVLCAASRAQCHLINLKFQEKFKMKLDRALNMKFKGLQAKLMALWAMPLPQAVSCWSDHLLHKMIVDRDRVLCFFARFEKDTLQLANNACRDVHGGKGLVDNLKAGGVSGNLLSALRGWIESASPDKGFERILDLYLQGKLLLRQQLLQSSSSSSSGGGGGGGGGSPSKPAAAVEAPALSLEAVAQLFAEAAAESDVGRELRLKVKFLLEKQAHELKLFMIDRHLSLDGDDAAPNGAARGASARIGFSWRSARVGAIGGTGSTRGSVDATRQESPSGVAPTPGSRSSGSGSARSSFGFSEHDARPHHSPRTAAALFEAAAAGGGGGSGGSPQAPKSRRHSQSLASYDERDDADEAAEAPRPSPGGGLIRQNSLFAQLAHRQQRAEMAESGHVDLVYGYLLPRFEAKDADGRSCLAEDAFWRTVEELPLAAFGLNAHAVDKVRAGQQSWLTVEEEGAPPVVYYYETLLELAETLVGAVLGRLDGGERSVPKVVAALAAQPSQAAPPAAASRLTLLKSASMRASFRGGEDRDALAQLSRQPSAIAAPALGRSTVAKAAAASRVALVERGDEDDDAAAAPPADAAAEEAAEAEDGRYDDCVPPYFLQLLLDTITAFDLDLTATLSAAELELLVAAMQVPGLGVAAFLSDEQRRAHHTLTPREVLRVVSRRVARWFSPAGRLEDHFICLVDVQSGAYFWFNARDESSVWAETAAYDDAVVDGDAAADGSGDGDGDTAEAKQSDASPAADTKGDASPAAAEGKGDADSGRTTLTDEAPVAEADGGSQRLPRRVQSSPRLSTPRAAAPDAAAAADAKAADDADEAKDARRSSGALHATKSASALLEAPPSARLGSGGSHKRRADAAASPRDAAAAEAK